MSDTSKKSVARKQVVRTAPVTAATPAPRKARKVLLSSRALVVCGIPWAPLAQVFEVLKSAGVASAKDATSGSIRSMAEWHERLLAGVETLSEQIEPSRIWQLVAAEVFMSNADAPLWGWADSRSTWLLDYWLEFDPSTVFVLVRVAPERMLAAAVTGSAQIDTAMLLEEWARYHAEFLRFQEGCPGRVVIIDADEVLAQPDKVVAEIAKALGLSLSAIADEAAAILSASPSPLAELLSRRMVAEADAVQALQAQLDRVTLLSMGDRKATRLGLLDEAKTEYVGLQNAALHLNVVEAEQASLKLQVGQTQAELAELRVRAGQQSGELGKAQGELNELRDHVSSQAAELNKYQADAAAARQEAELLLQQLHQVQEELESYFNRLQHSNTEKAGQAKELQALTTARDAAVKAQQAAEQRATQASTQVKTLEADKAGQAKELQVLTTARDAAVKAQQAAEQRTTQAGAQIKTLEADKAGQAKELQTLTAARDVAVKAQQAAEAQLKSVQAELQQENDMLLQQLHQVQEELENYFNQLQAGDAALKTQQAAEMQLKSAQTALQQDNDLLLMQLHQVQEELERYYLQYQEGAEREKVLEKRLTKALTRAPGEVEVDAVVPLAVGQAKSHILWRLEGLGIGARVLPAFEVVSRHVQGKPVLLFDPATAAKAFVRPLESPLMISSAVVPALHATDWELVRRTAQAIEAACSKPEGLQASGVPIDAKTCRKDVGQILKQLAAMPATLRFDSVHLRSERVIQGYEHLWIVLDNACFADRRWTRFEFRIGAALVKKGTFSMHPRLEFPTVNSELHQFENWFEECEDDLGPKFEQRFELKKNAMDMEAWKSLSPHDHQLMISLVRQLPSILVELQKRGELISRDWKDWQSLSAGIYSVLNKCLQSQAAQAVVVAN